MTKTKAHKAELPLFILILLISFASVNAVLFTPALPDIENFFALSSSESQLTLTIFLAGYALSQLIHGPLSNRFGRKKTLFFGVIIQILSSLLCASAESLHNYPLLIAARFVLALGSGVGLKITVTMLNEYYSPQKASQKMSLLMVSFAIVPGLGIAVGGVLNTYFGWGSCFYAGALYGLFIMWLVYLLPEPRPILKLNALKIKQLVNAYYLEFSNFKVTSGAIQVGLCSCYIYVFDTLTPFIAISLFGMSSKDYGFTTLIPMTGVVLGSFLSAKLTHYLPLFTIVKIGILLSLCGTLLMICLMLAQFPILISLFLPTFIVNAGQVLILANSSTISMNYAKDKAHGSAVVNFIGVGLAAIVVLVMGYFTIYIWIIPFAFSLICLANIAIYLLSTEKLPGIYWP